MTKELSKKDYYKLMGIFALFINGSAEKRAYVARLKANSAQRNKLKAAVNKYGLRTVVLAILMDTFRRRYEHKHGKIFKLNLPDIDTPYKLSYNLDKFMTRYAEYVTMHDNATAVLLGTWAKYAKEHYKQLLDILKIKEYE